MNEVLDGERQDCLMNSIISAVSLSCNETRDEYVLPSAVYRPSLSIDGNQWCALYGANLQDGVAGFGDSPAAAMKDFDRNWYASLSAVPAAEVIPGTQAALNALGRSSLSKVGEQK